MIKKIAVILIIIGLIVCLTLIFKDYFQPKQYEFPNLVIDKVVYEQGSKQMVTLWVYITSSSGTIYTLTLQK